MRNLVLSVALALVTVTTVPASARIVLVEVCNNDQSLVLVTTVTSDGLQERGVCRTAAEHLFEFVEADGSVRTFETDTGYLRAIDEYNVNRLVDMTNQLDQMVDRAMRKLLD